MQNMAFITHSSISAGNTFDETPGGGARILFYFAAGAPEAAPPFKLCLPKNSDTLLIFELSSKSALECVLSDSRKLG